tara:strand:- start:197 stop:565 length:369 start_codon:yes stop_codon:yes gene_type:complete
MKGKYSDLVGIVKMMDFNHHVDIRNYGGSVFSGKKYPHVKPTINETIKSIKRETTHRYGTGCFNEGHQNFLDADSYATNRLSNFVYQNISYNHPKGNWKKQFDKARGAFYYFKRLEEAGFVE